MSDNASDRSTDAPRLPTGDVADVTVATVSADGDVDPTALLADVDDLQVEALAEPDDVSAHLDGVDCVLGELPPTGDDLRRFLADVRAGDPALPVAFAAVDLASPVVAGALEADLTAVVPVEPPAAGHRLAHRIRDLVAHRQSESRAEWAATAAAAARDGLAVVAGDGTVAFANRSFARLFGATPDAVRGRPWQSLFEPAAADRLETDALAAVDDGWEWLGTCEGRRADGEPVELQVRVANVGDGAFVLAATRSRSDGTGGTEDFD